MGTEQKPAKMKLDLGEAQIRAVRMRAGLDGVDPRDVVIAALELYMPDEITAARAKLTKAGPAAEPAAKKRRRSGQSSAT